MQALDAITLKHLASELNSTCVGTRLNKIQHPAKHDYIFSLWGGSDIDRNGRNTLYINLDPAHPSAFLIHNHDKPKVIVPVFNKPTNFCMLLRKHLNNAMIESVSALADERVIDITFSNFNELCKKVVLVLSIELMGKHSNMILYDHVSEVVLGIAHSVGSHQSSLRELTTGSTYVPPPRQKNKINVLLVTPEHIQQWIQASTHDTMTLEKTLATHVSGTGIQLIEHTLGSTTLSADNPLSSDEIQTKLAQLQSVYGGNALEPVIKTDYSGFSLTSQTKPVNSDSTDWQAIKADSILPNAPVLSLMHDYFIHHIHQKHFIRLQSKLLQSLATQQQRIVSQQQTDESPDDLEKEREYLQSLGDALTTGFSTQALPDYPSENTVTFMNPLNNESITIDIDPALSWPDNAERYYQQSRKIKKRDAYLDTIKQQLASQTAYHNELESLIQQAESIEDLLALHQDFEASGWIKPLRMTGKKDNSKRLTGISEYTSSDGFTLFAGKSSEGNATLVGKIGKPDDIWFHIKDQPGSHVILKTNKIDLFDLPDQTVEEAASLAAWLSRSRKSSKVEIIYTQCRYIKKIPDSYPGHVNYKNEYSVIVDPALPKQASETATSA